MQNSSLPAPPFIRFIRLVLGLVGVCTSLTVLFMSMRAVMEVGGFCAEGGPYQIAVHCPKGVAYLTPLSIFLGLGFAALYAFSTIPGAMNVTFLFWSGLFASLGYNFLDFGIQAGSEGIAWWICAIIFFAMGLGPLLFLGKTTWKIMLWGEENATLTPTVGNIQKFSSTSKQRLFIFVLHVVAIAVGIMLGIYIYNLAAFS